MRPVQIPALKISPITSHEVSEKATATMKVKIRLFCLMMRILPQLYAKTIPAKAGIGDRYIYRILTSSIG